MMKCVAYIVCNYISFSEGCRVMQNTLYTSNSKPSDYLKSAYFGRIVFTKHVLSSCCMYILRFARYHTSLFVAVPMTAFHANYAVHERGRSWYKRNTTVLMIHQLSLSTHHKRFSLQRTKMRKYMEIHLQVYHFKNEVDQNGNLAFKMPKGYF